MNPISIDQYVRILPELVLTVFGIAVMMLDPFFKPGASRRALGYLSLLGTIGAMAATACHRGHDADVIRDRTGAHLHRAGNLFNLDLHSGRLSTPHCIKH
jgi:NADH:ubiquinone oxidoreductase subunit 2 (subunit N)